MLHGCASTGSALLPEMPDWGDRQRVLAHLDEWAFNGRIAVKSEVDGFNGKLRWAQDRDTFEATASGPFGAGAVRIEGDGRAVILTDKDGVRTELGDAETDIYLRFGWTIPVASLRYWALGIPDPSQPADTVFDPAGQLSSLRQRDWIVSYSRYADGGGQTMPKILTAENSNTRVRLVIDHWTFFNQDGAGPAVN